MSPNELTTALYFAAVIQVAADGSQTRLIPLERLKEPLAPHETLAEQMLLSLQALNIIEPELKPSYADDWLLARYWMRQGFKSVGWRVLRQTPIKLADIADDLPSVLDAAISDSDLLIRLLALWEDLALAESVEFLRSALARSGYDTRWADEAAPALQQALRHFSLDQVTYLAHIALRSVALTRQRGGFASCGLGRLLAGAISDYARRATAEKWLIRGIAQEAPPRSALVRLFVDTLTRLGTAYNTEPPSSHILVQAVYGRLSIH